MSAVEPPDLPRYPYLHIDVPPDEADALSAMLFDLGAEGVEERDETTLLKGTAGGTTLVASFATRADADAALAEIDAAYAPRIEEVIGDDWRDAWKKYFKPFDLCEGIVVRPPWEPFNDTRGWSVLELEPGRAFGTGLHETTSLVAGALKEFAPVFRGKPVLDAGCGSGILALVALTLGAASARAVDCDPAAVDVTLENAARNALSARIEADTTAIESIEESYPVVVANIEARVLIPLATALRARVAPGGLLVLSGILVPQKDEVCAAYDGMVLEGAPERGEWTALIFRQSPRP